MKLFGTKRPKNNETDIIIKASEIKTYGILNNNLPKYFDPYDKWGDILTDPIDQGSCQSCWAVASAQAMSDRLRIKKYDCFEEYIYLDNHKIKDFLSPYYIISCTLCGDITTKNDINNMKKIFGSGVNHNEAKRISNSAMCEMGCHGGYISHAQLYLTKKGSIPMSQDNNRSYYACPLVKEKIKAKGYSQVSKHINPKNKQEHYDNVISIKNELYNNGPVVCGYVVYDNHYNGYNNDNTEAFTKNKLYYKIEGNKTGDKMGDNVDGHAVSIVGWGEEYVPELRMLNKTELNELGLNSPNDYLPYWICRNSYGIDDENTINGYFKMPLGNNFCNIESDVWCTYV